MNVLHVITDLSIGGAQTMLCKLLGRMDRSRFKSAVAVLMGRGTMGPQLEALGVPVYPLGLTTRSSSLMALGPLRRVARKLQPHLIQGWMYHGNAAAYMIRLLYARDARLLWNIRHSVYDLHDEKRRTAWLIRLCGLLSPRTDRVVYNSRISARQHEELKYDRDRTIVIPNGFDCDLFRPSAATRTALRASIGADAQDFLIGLICRYHPMKDHANFLQAAAIAIRQCPHLRFVLVGRDVDESNPELTRQVLLHNLSDRVHLLGERQDVSNVTAGLDVACSASSHGEGFSNAIGEAMACGVPCVATDVGDAAWIAGKTGIIVPPRCPEKLAHAWLDMLKLPNGERQAQGETARRRILEMFSLDRVTKQYETLYEQVGGKA